MSRTYGITTCADCGDSFVKRTPRHKHCGCRKDPDAASKVNILCACGCGTSFVRSKHIAKQHKGNLYADRWHWYYFDRYGKPCPTPPGEEHKVSVPCACGCGAYVVRQPGEMRRRKGVAWVSTSHANYFRKRRKPYPYKYDGSERMEVPCGCGCGTPVERTIAQLITCSRHYVNHRHGVYFRNHGKPYPDLQEIIEMECSCGCGVLIKRKKYLLEQRNGIALASEACYRRRKSAQIQEMKQKAAMFDLLQANLKGDQ